MPFYCFLLLVLVCSGCAPRAATKVAPPEAAAWASNGKMALERGDCRAAVEAYNLALSAVQGPSEYTGLGMALLACRNPQGAVRAFEEAARLAPENPRAAVNLGAALAESGNISAAETQYDRALRQDPMQYEATVGKAAMLLRRSEPEKALKILSVLPAVDAGRPEAQFNRALALHRLGLAADAAALLTRHPGYAARDPEVLNALGVIALEMKKNGEAISLFDQAIASRPEQGIYYYNRANALSAQKKIKEAVTDHTRALAFDPELTEAYVNRGELHFLLNDKEQGCADLEAACKAGLCDRLDRYKASGRCSEGL